MTMLLLTINNHCTILSVRNETLYMKPTISVLIKPTLYVCVFVFTCFPAVGCQGHRNEGPPWKPTVIKGFLLQDWVGQNTALHASPNARTSAVLLFFLAGLFSIIFSSVCFTLKVMCLMYTRSHFLWPWYDLHACLDIKYSQSILFAYGSFFLKKIFEHEVEEKEKCSNC